MYGERVPFGASSYLLALGMHRESTLILLCSGLGCSLFYVWLVRVFILFFLDGDSGASSSSDSDGGPGFFDGINDNPSEEAFLAASSAKKSSRGREPLGGALNGGDGGGADSGGAADAGVEGKAQNGGSCGDRGQVEATSSSSSSSRHRTLLDNVSDGAAAGDVESQHRIARRKISETEERGTLLAEKGQVNGKKSKGAPSNFSRVDPSLPRAELAERFPLFLEAESCTVEVEAGQMLYLPAGWFHEVHLRCKPWSGVGSLRAARHLGLLRVAKLNLN